MTDDVRFLIECLTAELVERLINDYGWSIPRALDVLYTSDTFRRLNDPDTGLYYEGPVYVYSFLRDEIGPACPQETAMESGVHCK